MGSAGNDLAGRAGAKIALLGFFYHLLYSLTEHARKGMSRLLGRDDRLGNGWALVDLGDFKSLCRAKPSEVGSIPTHSRQLSLTRRRAASDVTSPKFERRPLRTPRIVAVVTAVLVTGAVASIAAAPTSFVGAGLIASDSTAALPPDSLHTIVVKDSLGVPGTLKGQTTPQDPEQVKEMLERMGSSEVAGKTEWERKKNPKVAMLCSALLPGLGQTYNGRRLKVGLMVGFSYYYFSRTWLNWRSYEASIARRDTLEPGSSAFVQENQRADFWKEEARTYLWWSGAVWLLGILDSWIDAHLYDVREYTPPPHPETSGLPVNAPGSYVTIGFDLEWAR